MKKATTITAALRPRPKTLIARVVAGETILYTRKMRREIPREFAGGMSIYAIATRHGCTILCAEGVLRLAMRGRA